VAVTFRNPPINEVVIGKSFSPLATLSIPHYGLLWQLVRNDFPSAEHAAPVADANELWVDSTTGTPLPRVWFVSADRTRLLQLQADRFYYNWRQTDQREKYVRFKTILADYRGYEALLDEFARKELGGHLVPRRLHLTYVNVFQSGVEWNEFSDVAKLMKGMEFVQRSGYLQRLERGQVRLEYLMRDCPGVMQVHLASATHKVTGDPLLRLELAATLKLDDAAAVDTNSWFEQAHLAIVNGFCEVTTDRAQSDHWKRES
jgi:uncharacterized protein (TIGR04255 family)